MNLLKHKTYYLIFSFILMIPGIIFIAKDGLKLGIDFTGGSVSTYKVSGLKEKDLEDAYTRQQVEVLGINKSGNTVTIRTKPIDTSKNASIVKALKEKDSKLEVSSFETIGPTVGGETTKKAFMSVLISSFAIMLYIAYSFKNIPAPYSSLRFGISAIIAMLHDAFIVVGSFAILGHYLKVEIDALFITALLTVIGFSVHDTIVVFDRIRENLNKLPKTLSFTEVANYSLVETLNRSLTTSLTVIITLSSLFVLGGASIRYFVLALLIGIVSGTYSSLFTATPILVIWESFAKSGKKKK